MKSSFLSARKLLELSLKMAALGVSEADLEESFIRSGGPGGQKINKTSIAVRLRHVPSGVEVRCDRTRSQAQNRYLARLELCERLERARAAAKSQERQAQAKVARAKRKRPKKVKERMLETKRRRGLTKKFRERVKE